MENELLKFAQSHRRDFIKAAVKSVYLAYPEEYKQAVERATKARNSRSNKFALADKDMDMRWGVTIPNRLWIFINAHLDGFLDDKTHKGEMKWFIKEFPQFAIPEKY